MRDDQAARLLSTPHVIYQHRQAGWAMLVIACVPTLCVALRFASVAPSERSLPPALFAGLAVVTAFMLLAFTSMSVIVTRDHLLVRFGVGIVRKSFALDDIVDATVVRTRWYEGWGMRWTRRGMLYNVAGFDAVRLRLRNGRAAMLGSDDAQRLAAVIGRTVADRRRRASVTAAAN